MQQIIEHRIPPILVHLIEVTGVLNRKKYEVYEYEVLDKGQM